MARCAPVCLVSVLVEETHFISKTAHRGQSGSLLLTMSYYAFKKYPKIQIISFFVKHCKDK